MSGEFLTFFRLGVEHLLDLAGYDHLLFLIALVGTIPIGRWRTLFWLVTAFTVGHTLTLALATLDVVRVSRGFVEALIPATILITSLLALWEMRPAMTDRSIPVGEKEGLGARWMLALTFGLIHGLGFSGFLRQLLGSEESLLFPLLAFNVGLEVAQLLVVGCVVFGGALVIRTRVLTPVRWRASIASVAALFAVVLLVQRVR